MNEMKGFIRIFEAIIASVILLSSLSFFFVPIRSSDKWDEALLQQSAEDALAAIENNQTLKNYIMQNNFSALQKELKKMLPKIVDFYAEVDGIPNPVITVACNCTDTENDYYSKRFQPNKFEYKSRNITISFAKKTLDEALSDSSVNIIFSTDANALVENTAAVLNNIENKSVFLVADLTDVQVQQLSPIFGTEQKTGTNSADSTFYNSDNENNVSFRINNYFVNSFIRLDTSGGGHTANFDISGTTQTLKTDTKDGQPCIRYPVTDTVNCYKKGDVFTALGNRIKVHGVDADLNFAGIGILNRGYTFTGFSTTNGVDKDGRTITKTSSDFSTAKVNYQIAAYGKGRAVWFAGYRGTDIDQLVKSAILWASGEKYKMTDAADRNPGAQGFRKYGIETVLDGFETSYIQLVMWKIFY